MPTKCPLSIYALIYIQINLPPILLLCFNYFVTLVPRANLSEELQISKHLAFFIFSKIISLFPSLLALYTNDQNNKVQDLLKKQRRDFFLKTRSGREKKTFLMHTIIVELADANRSTTSSPFVVIRHSRHLS
jgi:hypothetical protein